MALKSPWILPFTGGYKSVFGDLNQYKFVVPLFGAAYAAPNRGTTISFFFLYTARPSFEYYRQVYFVHFGFYTNYLKKDSNIS